MTTQVIEDVAATARWRRRVAVGWAGAVSLVAGGAAAVGYAVGLSPIMEEPLTWLVCASAICSAKLLQKVWQRRSRPANAVVLRDALPTPRGHRPGWVVRRPEWMSRKDRVGALIATVVIAVAVGSGALAHGALMAPTVLVSAAFAVPAAVGLARRVARLLRFPAGVAMTADGLATADGLVAWDAIREAAVSKRRDLVGVQLTVAGRRRPLIIDGTEFAMPAVELIGLIEHYRGNPRHRLMS